ncbi:MAG: AsmA family protein, partial [Candidatus Delongbacteria bacterium]|nr:AsmA family protein [Candidatus Delongbacteria bacterium]
MKQVRIKIIKKILKYSVYLLTGLVVLITGLFIFINTDRGRGTIVDTANKYSPFRIELNKFNLNIFKGKVLLEGLRIFGEENIEICRIGRLFIDVQYKPLFSGKYVVDSLIIKDLHADISSDQINSLITKNGNKEILPDENKVKKPLDLVINKFEIISADIMYKDMEKSAEYGFRNNHISAKADVKEKKYSLDMTGSEIRVNSGDLNKTVYNDILKVILKNSELEIDPANFKTEGLDISFNGNIYELFTLPIFDMKLSAELETGKLFDRSAFLSKDSGKFTISATVKGELDYPELDFSVKHPSGVIYGQQVNSLDLTAKYKNKILNLKTDLHKGGNEKFNIDGILDLSSVFEKGLISSKPEFEKTIYDLMIKAEKFSLSNIPDMPDIRLDCGLDLKGKGIKPEDITAKVVLNTDLSPFKFKEFSLSSNAKIKADVNWEKETFVSFFDLKTGKLKWQDYEFSGVDIIASMNDKGSVEVKKLDLRMDSSFISLKGKSKLFDKNWKILKDPKIDIYLVGSNIKSKRFYPDIDTKINFNIDAKGKMNSLAGNYGLSTTGINYSGVEIEKISVKGTFAGKDIIMDSLNITGGGSNIIADGRITDLKTFKSRIRTENLKVDLLYPQIKELFKGDLSFDIEAGGHIKNPTVKGKVLLNNSIVKDTNLPELKLDIGFENSIADIYADIGFGINAKADLKSKEYSFVTKFENWDYSYLIPDNKNDFLTGIISGRIEGKGNLDKLKEYDILVRLDS